MKAQVLFVKQKTAYEMRISDWSSDVCSSDLEPAVLVGDPGDRARRARLPDRGGHGLDVRHRPERRGSHGHRGWSAAGRGAVGRSAGPGRAEIGRASWRERVWQYV